MKKIFKLILLESWFLKRTIFFMGLILIAFVAALLSVVSVLLDVPDGMYEGINEYTNVFTLTVKGVDESFEAGGKPLYGSIDGLTRYATLNGVLNTTPHTAVTVPEPEDEQVSQVTLTVRGYAVLEEAAQALFTPIGGTSATYVFPSKPGEISINKDIAKLAGVKPGDTVRITPDNFFEKREGVSFEEDADNVYKIVGYVNTTAISTYASKHALEEVVVPSAHFYFIPNEKTTTFSELVYSFPDARSLHAAQLDLQHRGIECKMNSVLNGQVENIATAQAFFGAVSVVLGLMVLFILYTLIAIFFRQRHAQICRLKLLGARNRTIAGVYCAIAVFLVLVAVVLGTLFSMAFNVYFIGLCGDLFDKFSSNFVSHFRPIIPTIVLIGMILFSFFLFYRADRKVRSAAIAQEIRHD